jgi:hypothetical protein
MFSWLGFQMNMDNYPHVTIAEDGSLCSTGQHRLDHNGDVSVYCGRMSKAHGQDKCEVSVTLPLNLTEPWGMTVISIELDETVE